MKRLHLWLLLLSCAGVGVQAEIYKMKDAQGNVIYTDTPGDKPAEVVNLPPLNTTPEEAPSSSIAPGTPAEEALPGVSQSVYKPRILSPKEGLEITAEQRDLAVAVAVSPGLGETDEFQLTIDGEPYGETTRSNSFVIREIPRGEHNIRVNVVSLEGKVLASSEAVRVFVLRPSVNLPARKAN